MKNMKWTLVFVITVCGLAGLCTANTEDFKISGSRIFILRLTDEAKTAIEAIVDKEDKTVIVDNKCGQDDFSAICQLGWIRKLEINRRNNEGIHDLSPLVQLKDIRMLKVNSSFKDAALDIASLAELTTLVDVDFHVTKITNTQAMSGLKNLRRVKLYMSAVDSIDFLKGTPEIRELNLYGGKHSFKDYGPLLGLKNLRKLSIYMNPQATDELLAPLNALTSLQEISMSNCNNITTLNFLANCKDMRTINAMWCQNLTDISALKKMDLLESVSISNCKINDISEFKDKKHLNHLDISKTVVSDISPLNNCVSLRSLNLEKTSVEDLSSLANCFGLQDINIKDSKVNDISILSKCNYLHGLEVSGAVPQEQIHKLKDIFPDLRIQVK